MSPAYLMYVEPEATPCPAYRFSSRCVSRASKCETPSATAFAVNLEQLVSAQQIPACFNPLESITRLAKYSPAMVRRFLGNPSIVKLWQNTMIVVADFRRSSLHPVRGRDYFVRPRGQWHTTVGLHGDSLWANRD
jgi:hypothetical protein